MNFLNEYKFWLDNDYFDVETHLELEKIKDNPKEIEERFYKELEFGTGGLRGIIGAGTNRINIYTVRKVSQGLANYISKQGNEAKKRGIVIAYDSRYKSPEFALEAAKVFAGNGINAFLFDELRPTPELSFAVRFLKAAAGIVVTASHNPKEYNGYKVYGDDGAQLSLEASDIVIEEINNLFDITAINLLDEDEALKLGYIKYIGEDIDDEYISSIKSLSLNSDLVKKVSNSFGIIYTPLHGAGNKPVRRILKEIGFESIIVVKEQEKPDCNFCTVKSPNPEEKSAFKLAIELAEKEDIDLIIGTDPDCDRLGVVVRTPEGQYEVLTGNQIGCLLMEYILSQKMVSGTLPDNGFVVKTIVSTELGRVIAESYGVELVEVLTGFKFIGEKIKEMDEFGDKKFLFGFEESYGYLAGTFARDKDAVVAAMLVSELAAYYKSKGMSLYNGIQELYKKYGYYLEGVESYFLKGKDGVEKINKTMEALRNSKTSSFNGSQVAAVRDYLNGEIYTFLKSSSEELVREELNLPKSNVLYFEMEGEAWFCVRPSGTEPKIKIYFGVTNRSETVALAELYKLKDNVLKVITKLLGADEQSS